MKELKKKINNRALQLGYAILVSIILFFASERVAYFIDLTVSEAYLWRWGPIPKLPISDGGLL